MFLKLAITIALFIPLFDYASEKDQKDAYDRRDISCPTKTPSPPNTPRTNSDKK